MSAASALRRVKMSKLDQVVFLIENGQIVESKIRGLSGYIEETTTPRGVGSTYHTREYPKFTIDGEDFTSREDAEQYAADNELTEEIVEGTSYELWTWGYCGNFPKQIETFSTAAEAQEALEETFYQDFWNCSEFNAFPTREQAEQFLADNAE